MVRDFVAPVTRTDRPFRTAAGNVADHVPPVHKIDIGPAGKAQDWDSHLTDEFDDIGLEPVGSGHESAFRADLTPAGPLHELPEKTGIDPVNRLVSNAKNYIVRLRRWSKKCGEIKETE